LSASLTANDPLDATNAMDAGLGEIATELLRIVNMYEDEGVKYYNDNLGRIGKWPRCFGYEQSLTFFTAWWKSKIEKQARASTSRSPKHAGLISS